VDGNELNPISQHSAARSNSSTRQPDGARSRAVARWHALLRANAVLSLALWALAALAATRGHAAPYHATDVACLTQLLLSAGYVFACAFRSWLPVYDIPRVVIVDSRLSNVIVGRSVATVGELCFAAQWALTLQSIAHLSHSTFAQVASLAIVPLIVLAEVCSWYAVLTTAQLGHVIENSIWGALAALLVISMLVIGPHRIAALYPPLIACGVGAAAYAAFMFWSDVPMYWSRWLADQASGRQYLSVAQGFVDVCRRRVVSSRWEDWKSEVLWMSLYFTFGVWSSIVIVYVCLSAPHAPH
jgi:hypothetical protein